MTTLTRRTKTVFFTLGLLLVATAAYATVTLMHLVDTTTTAVLTLTNLANNTRSAAGSTFDNRQGQLGKGYRSVMVQCVLTFGANPNSNSGVDLWFRRTIDGTNFEDLTNGRLPNATCPATPGQTGTRVIIDAPLPAERLQVYALNNATGQQINSGTISFLPFTGQGTP
jgi:hypothetical protein